MLHIFIHISVFNLIISKFFILGLIKFLNLVLIGDKLFPKVILLLSKFNFLIKNFFSFFLLFIILVLSLFTILILSLILLNLLFEKLYFNFFFILIDSDLFILSIKGVIALFDGTIGFNFIFVKFLFLFI